MLQNYYGIDENTTIESFLREVKEKKNFQYIILDTDPRSLVDIRTLALKGNNVQEKLKSLKHPLSISDGESAAEYLDFIIGSGERVIGTPEGYFDFTDALKEILHQDPQFLSTKISELNQKELIVVQEEDRISHAKELFHHKKVNLLPVINAKGDLTGEVRTRDFIFRDLISASRHMGRGNKYDENYHESTYNLPVSNIMNSTPLTIEIERKIKDAAKLMAEKSIPSILVVDEDKLVNILSYKDIFEFYRESMKQVAYTLEYVGTSHLSAEDFYHIRRSAERSMDKIHKIYDGFENLKISFKVHGNKDGSTQKKLEVNLLLAEGNNVIQLSKEISEDRKSEEEKDHKFKGQWNTVTLVQNALKALEQKVIEGKKR